MTPDPFLQAVCFLCHCPSGHPDRALPGALPCGVRTFLPPSPAFAGYGGRSSSLLRTHNCTTWAGRGGTAPIRPSLAVSLLRNLILLEFLIEITARRVDDLGRLRNVPAVLTELLDEICALGHVLESTERPCFAGLGVA